MRNLKILIGVVVVLSVQACQQSSSNKKEGTSTLTADTTLKTDPSAKIRNDTANLASDEIAFIQKATVGGIMEVETGNLTTQKTKDPKIMAFAKRMIADHTKSGGELKQIAENMGIKVPGALPTEEQGHLAAMRQMQNKEYDENYMDMMVADHAKTIDLFNSATRFKNEKLKAFAVKTLPILQMHNKMAIGIDSLFKVKKPDNRGDDLPNVDKNRKN